MGILGAYRLIRICTFLFGFRSSLNIGENLGRLRRKLLFDVGNIGCVEICINFVV